MDATRTVLGEPPAAGALEPRPGEAARAARESGVNFFLCYACGKCLNGCPLSRFMDLSPLAVLRLLQLGQVATVLASHTPWLCATCHTCVTRCPNQVDLPRLMDWLKEESIRLGIQAAEPEALRFNQLFLREIQARGRVWEASLMARYQLAAGHLFDQTAMDNARLGLALLKRGRLALLPRGTRDRRWLRDLTAGEKEAKS